MEAGGDSSSDSNLITLFVRSGFDGKKYGACPLSQRIFMHLLLKSGGDTTVQFLVATVPPGKPPDQFRQHGLRNLPAIIYKDDALDTVEEIIDYIDSQFPWPEPAGDPDLQADQITRDFFSKFCFYIKV